MDIRSIRPALSPYIANDQTGYLWITTILGVIYTFLVAVARLYVKFRALGIDDYLLGVATIFHMVQSIPVFLWLWSRHLSFTSTAPAIEARNLQETLLAAEALAIVTLCLAKCSVTAIIIRALASAHERRWYICWIFMALNVLWGLSSVLALTVHCNDNRLAASVDHDPRPCQHQYLRWQAIAATDVGTDLIGFLTPVVSVWNLNMKVKFKAQVILAFSFRLPMISLSILHLESLNTLPRVNNSPSSATDSLLYLQAMLAWSLISATIPNMRGFIKSFGASFGMPAASARSDYRNGYPLVTLTGISAASRTMRRKASRNERFRPGRSGGSDNELTPRPEITLIHATSLLADADADAESHLTTEEERCGNDNGSQETIIAKEIQVT